MMKLSRLQRREVACVLRNTGNGWFIIDTDGHEPTGVSHVVTNTDHIALYFDFVAQKVGTFICMPDETYATVNRMIVGASVGYNRALLQMSIDARAQPAPPMSLDNPNGNIWVYGLFWL